MLFLSLLFIKQNSDLQNIQPFLSLKVMFRLHCTRKYIRMLHKVSYRVFPGYSWPSSFLTSATKRAKVKSNISSDTSSVYLLALPTRYCNLLSKPLHFSASSTPQRVSKPTPISVAWRLIPSFCATSRILKL